MEFGTGKYHEHTCKIYLNIILFDEAFKFGYGGKI
jgi:hypothetical protein